VDGAVGASVVSGCVLEARVELVPERLGGVERWTCATSVGFCVVVNGMFSSNCAGATLKEGDEDWLPGTPPVVGSF
jgi:hypothetical protein